MPKAMHGLDMSESFSVPYATVWEYTFTITPSDQSACTAANISQIQIVPGTGRLTRNSSPLGSRLSILGAAFAHCKKY